jgi:hypothetical protein
MFATRTAPSASANPWNAEKGKRRPPMPDTLPTVGRGFTVADIAARYRISPDKARLWIAKGILRAVNRNDIRSGKPSWVVTAEALAEFERGRQAATPPKPPRRRKKSQAIDFYPD